MLPLNGGHAIFVDAAGRKNDWLVNCGDENAVDVHAQDISPRTGREYNSTARSNRRQLVQNCGGAESLDELFGVGELWTSSDHFRSSAYNEVLSQFEKPPSRHKILNFGDKTGCWQILWPPCDK